LCAIGKPVGWGPGWESAHFVAAQLTSACASITISPAEQFCTFATQKRFFVFNTTTNAEQSAQRASYQPY
jgi:hypothetical protein